MSLWANKTGHFFCMSEWEWVLSFKINRSWLKETFKKVYKHNAAGPESLEDYF